MNISVIMPLFNKEKECLDSIKSVLTQTYLDYELIIVDDGSNDSSVKKIEQFLKELGSSEQIKIIKQENSGVSSARNRGVLESNYDYITFLDADDLWHAQFLEVMVQAKNEFPQNKWFACNCKEFTGGVIKDKDLIPELDFKEKSYFQASIQDTLAQSAVYTGSFVIQKKLFNEVGGYPTGVKHSEDYDLYFRLASLSSLVWTANSFFYYRQDAENKASKSKSIRELPPFVVNNKHLLKGDDKDLRWKNEFLVGLLVNWIEFTIRSGLFRPGLKLELVQYAWACRNTNIFKKRVVFRALPVTMINFISNNVANQLLSFSFKRLLGTIK